MSGIEGVEPLQWQHHGLQSHTFPLAIVEDMNGVQQEIVRAVRAGEGGKVGEFESPEKKAGFLVRAGEVTPLGADTGR